MLEGLRDRAEDLGGGLHFWGVSLLRRVLRDVHDREVPKVVAAPEHGEHKCCTHVHEEDFSETKERLLLGASEVASDELEQVELRVILVCWVWTD